MKTLSNIYFSPTQPTLKQAVSRQSAKTDLVYCPVKTKLPSNRQPRMRGWEVETCVNLPPTPEGEADYDNATYKCYEVDTHEQALALANRLLPNDCFGAIEVNEFYREPYEPGFPGLRKEYIGESEYVERE